LTKPEHYARFKGSAVKVKTYQQINGQKVFHGKLLGMADEVIKLELQSGIVMDISLNNIAKTSLEVEF
jgi:ribosome maturation factor RimP